MEFKNTILKIWDLNQFERLLHEITGITTIIHFKFSLYLPLEKIMWITNKTNNVSKIIKQNLPLQLSQIHLQFHIKIINKNHFGSTVYATLAV